VRTNRDRQQESRFYTDGALWLDTRNHQLMELHDGRWHPVGPKRHKQRPSLISRLRRAWRFLIDME